MKVGSQSGFRSNPTSGVSVESQISGQYQMSGIEVECHDRVLSWVQGRMLRFDLELEVGSCVWIQGRESRSRLGSKLSPDSIIVSRG